MNIKLLTDNKMKHAVRKYPVKLRNTTLVAEFIKVPANQLFKSLVVVQNNIRPLLVMIPSNTRLNLKELEVKLGIQSLRLATKSQVKKLTGMQIGGVSPLGLLDKNILIYITNDAMHILG